MRFFATFGQGQHGILKDYYIEIEAESREIACRLMYETFGDRWSMLYDQKPSMVLKRIVLWDDRGNRIREVEAEGPVLAKMTELMQPTGAESYLSATDCWNELLDWVWEKGL